MSQPPSTPQPNSTAVSYSQLAFAVAPSHNGTGSPAISLNPPAPPQGNPRTQPWRLRGLSSHPVSACVGLIVGYGGPPAPPFPLHQGAPQLGGSSGPNGGYNGPIPTAATRTSSYVASIRATPSTASMTFTHTSSDEASIKTANKILSMSQKIKSLTIDLAKHLDKFKSVNRIGADKARAIDSAMRALSDEIIYVYSATPSTDDVIQLIEKVSAEFEKALDMINETELTVAMAGVILESDENEDTDCEASLAALIAALQL